MCKHKTPAELGALRPSIGADHAPPAMLQGWRSAHDGRPRCSKRDNTKAHERTCRKKHVAGLPLGKWRAELGQAPARRSDRPSLNGASPANEGDKSNDPPPP